MKIYKTVPHCHVCDVDMFLFENDSANGRLIYRCPQCGVSEHKANEKPRTIVDSNKQGLSVGSKKN